MSEGPNSFTHQRMCWPPSSHGSLALLHLPDNILGLHPWALHLNPGFYKETSPCGSLESFQRRTLGEKAFLVSSQSYMGFGWAAQIFTVLTERGSPAHWLLEDLAQDSVMWTDRAPWTWIGNKLYAFWYSTLTNSISFNYTRGKAKPLCYL